MSARKGKAPPSSLTDVEQEACGRCGHVLGEHDGRWRCCHAYYETAAAAAAAGSAQYCGCRDFEERHVVTIPVVVEPNELRALAMLARSNGCTIDDGSDDALAAHDAIRHLIESAAGGVRRPGSWERPWIMAAFGDVDTEPHVDGVSWHEQPRSRKPRGYERKPEPMPTVTLDPKGGGK